MEEFLTSLFDLELSRHPMIYLGVLLLASSIGGLIARRLKAPRVIGFLLTGMIFSPSALGIFNERLIREELSIITHVALSIIAFSIGGSLELTKLKRLGKQIVVITFTQALGAFFLSIGVLSLFFILFPPAGTGTEGFWNSYFPLALVIAAISAATAPAATLALVQEYKARGPFITVLLGVVALDDGLTILIYAFSMTIAHGFLNQQALSLQQFLLFPMLSIIMSLAIGAMAGFVAKLLIRYAGEKGGMLAVMLGGIFLTGGIAGAIDAHPLLANMMLGFVVVNYVKHHENLFEIVEAVEGPFFCMFFALAGAHLDLSVIETAGILAVMITLGRFAGKLLGSRFGAGVSNAPDTVRKYLGFALLPTAGVTVGLVLQAEVIFPDHLGEIMINGVLASVLINELLTPFLLRFALFKSGAAARKTAAGERALPGT